MLLLHASGGYVSTSHLSSLLLGADFVAVLVVSVSFSQPLLQVTCTSGETPADIKLLQFIFSGSWN